MNYTNDILARLQKGEKIEDIATQLTKELNEANNAYNAERKEAEAKKKKDDERLAAANEAIKAFNKVIKYSMTDDQYKEFSEAMESFPPQDLLDLIDEEIPALLHIFNFQEKVKALPTKMEDPIEKFLNLFVR